MSELTPAQIRVLDSVCRTNGGGFRMRGRDTAVVMRLIEKGLVQGKSGLESTAVHTPAGLALWRKLQAEKP